MKVGDLVMPHRLTTVTENMNPTFTSGGRSRTWAPDQAVMVVDVGTRLVGRSEVLKLQLLIDGELWWIGAGSAKPAEKKSGQS